MHTLTSHLGRIVAGALAVILALLVALAAFETAAWALFEVSWAATSEITGVLLIWFGLLGAAYGIQQRIHLGVDVVVGRLPPRLRALVTRFAFGLVGFFGSLLAVYGARLSASVSNTLPATGLSAAVQYFPTVVCGALMVIFALPEIVFGPAEPAVGSDDG